ncbi:MAG: DUF1593 domain-containing protein, partial [bacterium]|nr:DUF1593 domain-containing protein [bacterium]
MHDGWRVVEEGDSYAAVKLLSPTGGQHAEEASWDEYGFLRPNDPYALVVLVAGRRTRSDNLDQFTHRLDSHRYGVSDGWLAYRFVDTHGERIELGLAVNDSSVPTVNGEPVNLAPEKVYDSPFINSGTENSSVKVTFDDEELVIPAGLARPRPKPRVIVTTDGETDDRCSMIRFLLYANEWEILGLIHSSSKYHWEGDQSHPGKDWEPVSWLDRQLDAYATVFPSLKNHSQDYPLPDYLRSQVFVGNIALEGDVREPTPGSDRIVETLLDSDDSPVWLQAWGGSNTIARALKTIAVEYPDRIDE